MNTQEYVSSVDVLKVCHKGNFETFDPDQLYNAFKYLRDLCTKNHSFQNYLCNDLLKSTVDIVNKIFLNYKEEFLPALKQGLQFLYNLTVENDQNKLCIWEACRIHIPDWIKLSNASVKNYTCAVLYNITLDHEDLCLDVVNNISLLNNVFYSTLDGIDFAILLVESLWKMLNSEDADMLMNNLYKCDSSILVPALNLLFDFLKENEVCFCFTVWLKDKYKAVLKSINAKSEIPVNDLQEGFILLKLIVILSGRDKFNLFLQQDIELLLVTKFLLEKVHFEGKNPESIFSPTENIFTQRTSVENLKANLIRLIGNLCWRNRAMQDIVRESNGLPLILDCCIRDGKNPFITEIVVFAIRNLCEGNLENQKFIKELNEETHNEMSERTQSWPSVFVPS